MTNQHDEATFNKNYQNEIEKVKKYLCSMEKLLKGYIKLLVTSLNNRESD